VLAGLTAINSRVSQKLSSKPNPPPKNERSKLSVSSCRIIRKRLAPSAVRTAISFCARGARDKIRDVAQALARAAYE